jgi:hypothetical protein
MSVDFSSDVSVFDNPYVGTPSAINMDTYGPADPVPASYDGAPDFAGAVDPSSDGAFLTLPVFGSAPDSGISQGDLMRGATYNDTERTSGDLTTNAHLNSLLDLVGNLGTTYLKGALIGNIPSSADQTVNRRHPNGTHRSAGTPIPPSTVSSKWPLGTAVVLAIVGFLIYRWIGAIAGLILGYILGRFIASSSVGKITAAI